MNLSIKLSFLEHIYKVYEEFAHNLNVACKRSCDFCCTRNVTVTTLEGYKIIQYLTENHKSDLIEKIKAEYHKARFQPRITTNHLAEICMQGEDAPEEESLAEWGACPFLQDNECPLYPARPFGCRCFVSEQICMEQGEAVVNPFVITVNNLFLQYIEHIDLQGYFGNLSDILLFLESDSNLKDYRNGNLKEQQAGLLVNHPAKILMIPPEHRERIKPIMDNIQNPKGFTRFIH